MPRSAGQNSRKNKSGIKTKQVTTNPELKSIKATTDTEEQSEILKKPYKCVTCGKRYSKQTNNFSYSQSPLYNGNNHFLPTCVSCIDNLVEQYTEILGNQDDAIKRVCLHYDMYVDDKTIDSCKKISVNRSCIKNYIKMCNLQQNNGKTYDTYLKEISDGVIESMEHYDQLKEQGEVTTSKAALERWEGIGFLKDSDYKTLEDHYKMLKKQNPNVDNNQEIFIKDLCYIKLWQMKALKESRSDDFDKFTKLYRDTFKQAGLKTVQEVDTSNDETVGVTLSVISQYTPEEYYANKKLYKDFDGLGEYVTRFMTRPLKNLLKGTTERDKEYCVKGDLDED
jgi:hypothetical protein